MPSATNMTLLTIALAAILVLFGVNLITHIKPELKETEETVGTLGLNKAEVKGMAVDKNSKIYTLNQKQQNDALNFINRMRPVDKNDYPTKGTFEFTKLIVYRFDKPDVNLVPMAFQDQNLVFDVPALGSGSYMLDMSAGAFYDLIKKASQE